MCENWKAEREKQGKVRKFLSHQGKTFRTLTNRIQQVARAILPFSFDFLTPLFREGEKVLLMKETLLLFFLVSSSHQNVSAAQNIMCTCERVRENSLMPSEGGRRKFEM
jgi:hypothetical protein